MSTHKRIVSGTVALALLVATSMTAMPAPTQAATPIERFDAMGLTPMPEEMADKLRGEGLVSWAVLEAVKFVAKSLGNKVAAQLDAFLRSAGTPPSYSEYRQYFGTKASAILSVIPWYVKPYVVQ